MAKLPATSYVRMVDIWLIFTQLYPFLEVILYTIIELYNEEEETNHHGFKRDIPETQRQKGKWKIIYILYLYIITYVFRIKPPILGFFQWTQTYTKFQKVLVSMKVFQRYYMDQTYRNIFLESKVVPTFALLFTMAYWSAAVYCYYDYIQQKIHRYVIIM